MSKIPVKELSRILSEANGDVCLYVEDCQTGEVYTVNGEKKVQSASTIKVPILAMLLKAAQDGLIDLDEPREVKEVNRVPNGVIYSLNKNYKPTLHDMAWLMMVVSDNLATNEIIDVVGYDSFNEFWEKWGCRCTKLMRKMMDTNAIKEGRDNFTCACDMGRILSAVAKGEMYNKQISDKMFAMMRDQKLT
ncbi:MAG: serine hydrolase, partial [Oscillospiraceae bacterium]|nr:serine hydrolase [Oscillospiraceae bacterium]